MAYSYVDYIADGTTSEYTVPFTYIRQSDVNVYLNDTKQDVSLYSYNTDSIIKFATAPASGTVIRFQRFTDKVNHIVDFVNGSTLTEADLDLAITQLLYICQEAYDALDGETAVAAKEKCVKILAEVQSLYSKTKTEIDHFRKMWIDVQEAPSSPGVGEYDFETGRLTLHIPAGPTGPQGPIGAEGPQGLPGPRGEQGPRGIQGPQGVQGDRGPEGQQGPMGPQGIQGPRGETGPVGPQGPQGVKGDTGERGPQGPEGPKGATGDKGPLGDSPLPFTFGNFEVNTDGYLEFDYYGTIDSAAFSINTTTGHLEVTV